MIFLKILVWPVSIDLFVLSNIAEYADHLAYLFIIKLSAGRSSIDPLLLWEWWTCFLVIPRLESLLCFLKLVLCGFCSIIFHQTEAAYYVQFASFLLFSGSFPGFAYHMLHQKIEYLFLQALCFLWCRMLTARLCRFCLFCFATIAVIDFFSCADFQKAAYYAIETGVIEPSFEIYFERDLVLIYLFIYDFLCFCQ